MKNKEGMGTYQEGIQQLKGLGRIDQRILHEGPPIEIDEENTSDWKMMIGSASSTENALLVQRRGSYDVFIGIVRKFKKEKMHKKRGQTESARRVLR